MTARDDEDSLAERQADFSRLLARYRVMQGDRRAYAAESQRLMSRQRQELLALTAERRSLTETLGLTGNRRDDERRCEDLANLAENRDWVENQITEERMTQQALEAKRREVEAELEGMRRVSGGGDVRAESERRLQKRTEAMERQLEGMHMKYNSKLKRNEELRSEIDHLRLQRARFDLLYKKLDRTLTSLRRENAVLIEATTIAFQAREDAQTRITGMKEKLGKDTAAHTGEMKALVREVDHQTRLGLFIISKLRERREDPQLVAWRARELKAADEKREETVESRETLEMAFLHLARLTEEEEMERIVRVFEEREDENFALFAYVHELRALQGELSEQMSELRVKMVEQEKHQKEEEEKAEKLMVALDGCGEKANKKVTSSEQRLRASTGMLDLLMCNVRALFDLVNADRTTLDNKLASTTGVTIFNFVEHLRLVESRLIELVRIANYIALRDSDAPHVLRQCLMGSGPSAGAPPARVIAPTLAEELSTPEATQPLRRSEILVAVMPAVRRKEQEASREGPGGQSSRKV